MMLQIAHRDSFDVDIFLDDPQLLPYLDPARNDFDFKMIPDAYSGDGTQYLKIAYAEPGEIDFIVGQSLARRCPWFPIIWLRLKAFAPAWKPFRRLLPRRSSTGVKRLKCAIFSILLRQQGIIKLP